MIFYFKMYLVFLLRVGTRANTFCCWLNREDVTAAAKDTVNSEGVVHDVVPTARTPSGVREAAQTWQAPAAATGLQRKP